MSNQRIKTILDRMNELFGDYPLTELNYSTPFQCLIAVMMSAQTTDKQVNKVTATLFTKIYGPADVLAMGLEQFGQQIRTIGLWKGKAKNIYATSKLLLSASGDSSPSLPLSSVTDKNEEQIYSDAAEVYARWGYSIPDTIEEMIELPGVGVKTAKVVLYVLYRQRWVAVDTHVHRVMNRLGVVTTKLPDQTSKLLETIIPDTYKDIAHHTIIYFGRYLCIARKPKCEECPLIRMCPTYKILKETKKK